MSTASTIIASVAISALFAATAHAKSPNTGGSPIRTLLITGTNNHNWQYTSRVHKETLEATGRFTVDITDTPQSTLADSDALSKYTLFVLDWNDWEGKTKWGEAAERNFVGAVNAGTGVVAIHSANNAHRGWTEYEKMLGLMWEKGTTGHGKFHAFDVVFTDEEHPITKGLPTIKGQNDELYHKLVNAQNAEYRLLARAMSAKETGGTGEYEPMAFTLQFGKGRIFATPLGHVWNGDEGSKVSVLGTGFRALVCRGAEWAATGTVTLPASWTPAPPTNTLTQEEKRAGWVLLFDGKTTSGWRGYKMDGVPKSWVVKGGILTRPSGAEGGADLITTGQYGDFEFACDFRTSKGGNSGIIYRCTEEKGASYETGLEMQVLDDGGHRNAKPSTKCGAMYDLFGRSVDVSRPAGEWNRARVVCKGTRIEHWLNGFKVVDVDLASDEYMKAWQSSKWPGMPEMGKRMKGHIALQDHGDGVEYANLRILEIR